MRTYDSMVRTFKIVQDMSIPEIYKCKITSSDDLHRYVKPLFGDQLIVRESFWIIMLNQVNETVGHYKVSEGGIAGTVVDERLCVKSALDALACNVILCHNHPSGNTNPSGSDKAITTKLIKAFESLAIRVLDHVIVTQDSFYSFADENVLR